MVYWVRDQMVARLPSGGPSKWASEKGKGPGRARGEGVERPGSRAWLGPYDGEWRHGGAGCLPGTSSQSTPPQAQTRPCRQTSTRSREVSCEPPSPDLQPQGAQADQLPLGPRRVLRVRSRAGGGPRFFPPWSSPPPAELSCQSPS